MQIPFGDKRQRRRIRCESEREKYEKWRKKEAAKIAMLPRESDKR